MAKPVITDKPVIDQAQFGDITIWRKEGGSIEVSDTNYPSMKAALRDIADKAGIKLEEDWNTQYMGWYIIQQLKGNKTETIVDGKNSENDDVTLQLSCARGCSEIIRMEYVAINEDEIDEIVDLIDEECNSELDDILVERESTMFDSFHLWGDEDMERLSYSIENEDEKVINEGEIIVKESKATTCAIKCDCPEYLLIKRSVVYDYCAEFKVPANLKPKDIQYDCAALFYPIDSDWMGDTVIVMGGIHYKSKSYIAEDVSDNGAGDEKYALLKRTGDRYYEILAQTFDEDDWDDEE